MLMILLDGWGVFLLFGVFLFGENFFWDNILLIFVMKKKNIEI